MITLLCLFILFMIGFKITGAILSTFFWLFISLPIAIVLCIIGLVCFVTIFLIPLGLFLFGFAYKLVFALWKRLSLMP